MAYAQTYILLMFAYLKFVDKIVHLLKQLHHFKVWSFEFSSNYFLLSPVTQKNRNNVQSWETRKTASFINVSFERAIWNQFIIKQRGSDRPQIHTEIRAVQCDSSDFCADEWTPQWLYVCVCLEQWGDYDLMECPFLHIPENSWNECIIRYTVWKCQSTPVVHF